MKKSFKALAAAAVLTLGLGAGAAQAAFINGSVSITDGLTGLPGIGSTSVVSGLSGITHSGNGAAQSCGNPGDFFATGTCNNTFNATMTDWSFAGPFSVIISVNGFTFTLFNHGPITTTPLVCQNGSCADTLTVSNLSGTVVGNGFQTTAFTGSLSLTGSCAGTAGACTGAPSGGYTYSLSAIGQAQVPEPATLLLIGTALAGLGFMRRKQA